MGTVIGRSLDKVSHHFYPFFSFFFSFSLFPTLLLSFFLSFSSLFFLFLFVSFFFFFLIFFSNSFLYFSFSFLIFFSSIFFTSFFSLLLQRKSIMSKIQSCLKLPQKIKKFPNKLMFRQITCQFLFLFYSIMPDNLSPDRLRLNPLISLLLYETFFYLSPYIIFQLINLFLKMSQLHVLLNLFQIDMHLKKDNPRKGAELNIFCSIFLHHIICTIYVWIMKEEWRNENWNPFGIIRCQLSYFPIRFIICVFRFKP